MVSNLFSLLSKKDNLAGLRRIKQGNLMNQQVEELVSPNSVGPVVKYDIINEVTRMRFEETLHYQAPQTKLVQPIK